MKAAPDILPPYNPEPITRQITQPAKVPQGRARIALAESLRDPDEMRTVYGIEGPWRESVAIKFTLGYRAGQPVQPTFIGLWTPSKAELPARANSQFLAQETTAAVAGGIPEVAQPGDMVVMSREGLIAVAGLNADLRARRPTRTMQEQVRIRNALPYEILHVGETAIFGGATGRSFGLRTRDMTALDQASFALALVKDPAAESRLTLPDGAPLPDPLPEGLVHLGVTNQSTVADGIHVTARQFMRQL